MNLYPNEALCCNYVSWNDDSFTCDLKLGDQVAPEMNTRTQKVSTAYVFYLKDERMPEEKESTIDFTSIELSSFYWANAGLLTLELIDMISPIWILILDNIQLAPSDCVHNSSMCILLRLQKGRRKYGSFDMFVSIWLILIDTVSIYMIVTKKPFIFFESSLLEKGLLFLLAIDNMYVGITVMVL